LLTTLKSQSTGVQEDLRSVTMQVLTELDAAAQMGRQLPVVLTLINARSPCTLESFCLEN